MRVNLKNIMKMIFLFIVFQICIFIFFNKSTVAFAQDLDVIKSIQITNENGQNKENYIPGDRIRVDVQWEIKEKAKKDDGFTFTLPKELIGFSGDIDLKDKDNISYGKGRSDGNNIKFVFSEEVEKRQNIGGNFYVEAKIKCVEQIKGYEIVTLEFKVNGTVFSRENIKLWTGDNTSSIYLPDEVFTKHGDFCEGNPQKLRWYLRINFKRDNLGYCEIMDKLGPGHRVIPDSIKVYLTNDNKWLEKKELESNLKWSAQYSGEYIFDSTLNVGNDFYTIYYETEVTSKYEQYKNEATLRIENKQDIVEKKEVKTFTAGGEAWGDLKKFKGKLKIIKQDKKTNLRLSGAEFQLLDDKQNKIIANLKTDNNGEAITDDIPSGIYYLKEIKAPDGYESETNINSIDLNFKQDNIIERVITNKKIESKESQEPKVEPEKPEVKEPEVKEEPAVKPEKPEVKEPEVKEEPEVKPQKPEVKNPEIKNKKKHRKKKDHEPEVKPEIIEVQEPQIKEDPEIKPEKPEIKEPEIKEEPVVEPEIIIDPDDEVPLGNPEDHKEPQDPDTTINPKEDKLPENPEKSQDPEIIEDPEDEVPLGNIEPNKNPEKPQDNVKPTNKKENKELKPVTDNNSNTIKILPKTGESNKALFYIGGLIIIILGIFIKKRI